MKRIISAFLSLLIVLSSISCMGTFVASALNASPVAGDINGDGNVNSKDLTRLMKYLAGENVEVVAVTVDPNGDGTTNNKDLTRLMKYIAGDETLPIYVDCAHEIEAVEAAEATCAAEGNIAYWCCALCNQCFSDEECTSKITFEDTVISINGDNHTVVIDEAVEPTATTTGLTEGSHCSACGKILVSQIKLPMLEENYAITYKTAYGYDYLTTVDFNSQIPEESRTYTSADGLYELPILETEGYNFVGWFNGTSSSATEITEIPVGSKGSKTYYARWEPIEYTITFASEFISVEEINGHVIYKDTALPGADVMKLPGYKWLGWSDDNGILYNEVYPKGNSGHVTLHANWQSYRNQAVPTSKLAEPSVYVDEKTYVFTFELGQIKNVPLYTINDFGKMVPGQPVVREEVKLTDTIIKSEAEELAKIVSNATTKTSTWTLSNDWNKISSVSETHATEMGIDTSTIEYNFESASSEIALTKDSGESTNQTVNWGVNAKVYAKNTLETEASAKFPVECVNIGVGVKNTTEVGGELNGYYDNTTVNNSYWNTNESYNNSLNAEHSTTTSTNLSKHMSDVYNSSTSSSIGGSNTESEAYATATSESDEYTSTIAYTTEEIKTTTYETEYTTDTEGWWRQVEAGTISVYGVVTYDMETSTYSVYTYNVLEAETCSYMDFSMTSDDYNDYETGVIPFEIPISVNEYISTALGYTSDLEIDRETGIVGKYTGDSEHIHIPDYMTVSNGDGTYTAIKVVGIENGAFAGNTSIKSVRLGKYIEEIPDSAFEGCTSLESIEYEKIVSIGANAFAGCTSFNTFTVDDSVVKLGDGALANVPVVIVYANNSDVVRSAVNGKIKNLSIYLKNLTDELKDTTLTVSEATNSFALYGRDLSKNVCSYSNVCIESNASETIINGMRFIDNQDVPLRINSEAVTFAQVSVEAASGLALILSADTTNLYLQDKSAFSTSGNVSILSKGLVISKASGVNTTTSITADGGLLLYCGEFSDINSLFIGEKSEISINSYEQYYNNALPWTLASEVPEDAYIISEKWTYDLTTNITSDQSSVEGYTLYNTTSEWGEYGPWSSWSTTKYTETDSRDVEKKTIAATYKTQYNYSRYTNGGSQTGPCAGTWSGVYCGYYYERGWSDTRLSVYATQYSNQMGGYFNLYGSSSDPWYNETTKQVVVTSAYDMYRYRDRSLIYTYYHTKTESLESATEITISDAGTNETISNIQKWVKYVVQ